MEEEKEEEEEEEEEVEETLSLLKEISTITGSAENVVKMEG